MILMLLLLAAQATPATAPPPSPAKVDCTDADHRAFDFWIGNWNVYATGTETWVANSKIEKIFDCAISETYDQFVDKAGKKVDYHGRSISSYVPADKGWQQYYVDSSGAAATLKGGASDGGMVFLSRLGPVTNRMSLKPSADGRFVNGAKSRPTMERRGSLPSTSPTKRRPN